MKYYTIQDNNLLIAENEQALTRYYNNVFELPADYEQGKYIIGEKQEYEEVIDYDEDGNPIGSHPETITTKILVLNPNWNEEQYLRREKDFNKAFFNTSLGYIRRLVTMQDGSKKDFLSDLLPVISMGVQSGMPVNILTYDKPPFDEDVTDWEEYQHQVVVTPQFIQECFLQLSNDFLPINEENNEDTTDQTEL